MTFILGLTGSIGMGKSTTASLFKKHGVPVYDADQTVHYLYRGRLAPLIEVDRARLSAHVVGHPEKLKQLESIVHPVVQEEQDLFIQKHRHSPLIVLDIPLLFENGKDRHCDAVAVVSTDAATQRKRVMLREGMTEEKMDILLSRQMSDIEKRQRAQFLIDTSRDIPHAERQVVSILKTLSGR
ncbi:MAG: dephospho-CoA kinase [Alphaproteobacteria bacterium]|nr:dephospho-CoA kinase [Alphaproteobacteria bacterium]